ncbi:MAG: carboxymuconolactone decarboxylase family protein [Acidimicrobiia bacterium]
MDDDRINLANETGYRLFRTAFSVDALPGEPESAADFRRLCNEHAFADSWTRTALDDRTRSLLTVAILATLGSNKLRGHLGGALSLGVTPDEIVDLFVHLATYAGVARASDGFEIASELMIKKAARDAERAARDSEPG